MKKTVYITKYALTIGVFVSEMEIQNEGKSCFGKPEGFIWSVSFNGDEFHLTKEEAIEHIEKMRKTEIKSLKKKIHKLENLKIEI
jgi:hypothetical protein